MSDASTTHLIPTVTPEQLSVRIGPAADGERTVLIDLRTPKEYAEDHVPGALNIPLFRNDERALIGTLYKRESPAQAFAKGREVVVGRIRALFDEIASAVGWDVPDVDLAARVLELTESGIGGLEENLTEAPALDLPERVAIFHCWRGGLRSKSVVALLRLCGFDRAFCIENGYQGYRRRVLDELAAYEAPKTYVIRGFTGTGKTLVLRALEELRPGWTLDLEGLAGHRSSILGMVGLEPVTQKTFETNLAARLRELPPGGPLVVEGESRKIGDRIQPASIWHALQAGTNIELTATKRRRVEVLMEDYLAADSSLAELREKLPFIENRLGLSPGRGASSVCWTSAPSRS
jgi:tRNA 2-selenouridine synthase